MPAPIALFAYNRPEHILRALEGLIKNEEAKNSILFIFCDGPKAGVSDDQLKKIVETRKVIRQQKWCKQVNIFESETNKGLANSIIDGVTEVVNEFGSIIVLEDDLVVSPFFLKFMNEALQIYLNEEKVISIHGYLYPIKKQLPETFFLKGADCWGWATWKRGWDLFESDEGKLLDEIIKRKLEKEFDFGSRFPYLKMLKDQLAGKNDSWAIRWYASAFLNNKLTLYPGNSLAENIGNEGSGTHVKKTEYYHTSVAMAPVLIKTIPVEVNQEAFHAFREYFFSIRPTIWRKILKKFKL